MKTLYTAIATAHGGRAGNVQSSDGVLKVDLKVPKEMGGPGGIGTNPEQLFAGGYAACFESAVRHVARDQHIPIKDASITAHVTLHLTDEQKYLLSVELHGNIAGMDKEASLALMRSAHEVCPYSNATRGNVKVDLFVD
jgi:Ohr subfamily peroxiredoxin